MENHIIWLIDENKRQSRTYVNQLRMMLPLSITIEAIFPPYRQKVDYLPILEKPETACFMIDQRLKDTGIATYTGIELAQYLRGINSKIPIYILTNHADEYDEFMGGEWSVEEIIAKRSLSDDKQSEITKARIIRRIDVYEDILGQRSRRFRDLLRKSLNDELEDGELQELEELQFERTAPTLASELAELRQLEQLTTINQALLESLNQMTASGGKACPDGGRDAN
jgi:hypothetical protein